MSRWSPALAAAVVLAAGCATPPPPSQPTPVPVQAARANERPVPYPVVAPAGFRRAIERDTRNGNGKPGHRYWQQWTNYTIRTSVEPGSKQLTGSERAVYYNRSPDTLAVLYMHLHQNLYAPGAMRNEETEVTGGVTLTRVAVGGQAMGEAQGRGAGYAVEGTRLGIRPARPLLPGDSAVIETAWSFKVPQSGSGRMGWDADNLMFIAYFYPQMAVYDDVGGWQTEPYLSGAEFYMGYGDYDYTVTAPAGWTVIGTGELNNPADVMPADVLDRLRRAEASDTVVHVLTAADFGPGKATTRGTNGRLEWSFRAHNVRDVAFSMTRQSLWDAARTPVGDANGDGRPDYARVDALWRANAPRWRLGAADAQHSIAYLSRYTGQPYPWSHMTSVEGENIIGGGMEFPAMTLIGAYTTRSDTALYGVIAHELGHMWVPMIVGVDENRYGWMDEGTTDFDEAQASNDRFPGARDAHLTEQGTYVRLVKAGYDTDLMRWTNYQYPGPSGTFASYYKPSTVMYALRGLIGAETFDRTFRQYVHDWAWKHPQPWDFFNAFNAGSGRNLDWFWRTWYYEDWSLDQAVGGVADQGGSTVITVRDLGMAPMPTRLTVTRANGTVERPEIPVETWLSGTRTATVNVAADPSPVVRVEIDAESAFPDVNRTNNVWTRGS
jgi:hypothetical protein